MSNFLKGCSVKGNCERGDIGVDTSLPTCLRGLSAFMAFSNCIIMKTKWIILSLVFGLLFFGLGCKADSVAVEGIGAVAFFPGLTGAMERIWKEGEGV